MWIKNYELIEEARGYLKLTEKIITSSELRREQAKVTDRAKWQEAIDYLRAEFALTEGKIAVWIEEQKAEGCFIE